DTYLGGDDMDRALAQHWQKELNISDEELRKDKSLTQQLRVTAEEAKKHLTNNESFERQINDKIVRISKNDFNQLIHPLVERTITSCKNALKDAGLLPQQIDA